MIPTKPPPFFKNPEKWSADMQEFVKKCLVKNPEERMSATQLLQVKLGLCLILLLNSSHKITFQAISLIALVRNVLPRFPKFKSC